MAKKVVEKAAPKAKKAPKIIYVADLAEEFGMEPRAIRIKLRNAGLNAPEVEVPEGGFGPRSKYSWEEGSEELEKVRELLAAKAEKKEKTEKAEKAAPVKSKGGKKVKPVEIEEDDEDEDDDEDEEDDDEDEDDD